MSSLSIGAAILIGAVVVAVSNGNDEMVKAVKQIESELGWVHRAVDGLAGQAIGDFQGQADKILISYTNGQTETLSGDERDYYIVVQSDHVVIHSPKPGESLNAASERKLVPFASINSIERTGEQN